MRIYIPGMEMQKPGRYEAVIIVLDKSTAEIAISPAEDDIGYWKEYPLIPVPDHGDLIDRDKLEKDIDNYIGGEESRSRFHHWVQVQNVVIPREKGAET